MLYVYYVDNMNEWRLIVSSKDNGGYITKFTPSSSNFIVEEAVYELSKAGYVIADNTQITIEC
ncbi:Uncharacterised protein [Klebsiella pneumoniae]|nr:hypothetical protein CI741_26925 [Klebsiella pneumoniae subsp. pneumoniae]SYB84463.1 Uncharacterised protein [Klebsiella pneumoniae]